MSRNKNKFQDKWLSDVTFKKWLTKDTDIHSARCKLCPKVFSIGNMGASALVSHGNSDMHKDRVKDFDRSRETAQLFFGNQSKPASSSGNLDQLVIPTDVTKAEIRWVLKVVKSHFPLRSCIDLNELFRSMFPDSGIASKFQLDKTKCSYLINYGIGPYYKDILLKSINTSPFFSISFGESLNSILQQEQMDLQVRYWDEKSMTSQTRYLDSKFIRRPNAVNLANAINSGIIDLSADKLSQLSMDGPSTNWSVLEKLQR